MFERYTERARRVLFFARYEATQLGSTSIETEHLLLGLIREGKGLTSRIFARSHLSLESIRKEIEGRTVFREKVSTSVEIPFSAETKRVLTFAAEEADRLLHTYIGTEHLLLGLLREERSVAASILYEKGMRLASVREDIVQLLNEKTAPARPKETPLLAEFSRDLTDAAARNQLDPLVGRMLELERVMQVLCRRTNNRCNQSSRKTGGGNRRDMEIVGQKVECNADAEHKQRTLKSVFDDRFSKQQKNSQSATRGDRGIPQPFRQAEHGRCAADRADDTHSAQGENDPGINRNGVGEHPSHFLQHGWKELDDNIETHGKRSANCQRRSNCDQQDIEPDRQLLRPYEPAAEQITQCDRRHHEHKQNTKNQCAQKTERSRKPFNG